MEPTFAHILSGLLSPAFVSTHEGRDHFVLVLVGVIIRIKWCQIGLLSFLRRNDLLGYRKMIKTNLREQALVTLAKVAV